MKSKRILINYHGFTYFAISSVPANPMASASFAFNHVKLSDDSAFIFKDYLLMPEKSGVTNVLVTQ